MIRRLAAMFFIWIVCFSAVPQSVVAQTTSESAYRAALLELVAALQQQIALLQAQLADDRVQVTPQLDDDIPEISSYEILETYNIAPGATTIRIGNDEYERFFERFLELIPSRYRADLTHVQVYDGDVRSNDAYVRGSKYSDGRFTWYFGVSDELFDDDISDDSRDELIIHELAHIVSIEEALAPGAGYTCHEALAQRESCPNPNSMYGQFVAEFWPHRLLDQLADSDAGFRANQYSRYKDWFVSGYASTHPAEDFAETFMIYVTGNQPDIASDVTEQKLDFMDQFSRLRALRAELRARL